MGENVSKIRRAWDALLRFLNLRDRAEPIDPYAYVMAPKKPRPPHRSGAAVAELDE